MCDFLQYYKKEDIKCMNVGVDYCVGYVVRLILTPAFYRRKCLKIKIQIPLLTYSHILCISMSGNF